MRAARKAVAVVEDTPPEGTPAPICANPVNRELARELANFALTLAQLQHRVRGLLAEVMAARAPAAQIAAQVAEWLAEAADAWRKQVPP
jgi:hypothetical protein